MSEQSSGLGDRWRAVRGLVPWLVAGVYFPLYVAVDYVAGGSIAAAIGAPRSVSVGLFCLASALLVAGVVTASLLEDVSPSSVRAALERRLSGRESERSSVGANGAVNRRTVETGPDAEPKRRARSKREHPSSSGVSGAADSRSERVAAETRSGCETGETDPTDASTETGTAEAKTVETPTDGTKATDSSPSTEAEVEASTDGPTRSGDVAGANVDEAEGSVEDGEGSVAETEGSVEEASVDEAEWPEDWITGDQL